MCTQRNEDIVREVVDEFVSKNWAFTAYTITSEAKNRGADEPHRILKRVVHNMHQNGEIPNYSRSIASIPGLRTQPFLYTPHIQDISDVQDTQDTTDQDTTDQDTQDTTDQQDGTTDTTPEAVV